jgi:hypothetical protein
MYMAAAFGGGYNVPTGCGYTGTMLEHFQAAGFAAYAYDGNPWDCPAGSILLNVRNHTEMWLGNGTTVGAHIDERGQIAGGQSGDQSGNEVSVAGYYNYPWDYVLVPPEDTTVVPVTPPTPPSQPDSKPENDCGLRYQAHSESIGWCTPVRDGQIAGTTGFGARLEAIKIEPPSGIRLAAKAHLANVGWVNFGEISADTVIGSVGQERRLESIDLVELENTTGKHVYIDVHIEGTGWTGWKPISGIYGTVGQSKRIEAIRLALK